MGSLRKVSALILVFGLVACSSSSSGSNTAGWLKTILGLISSIMSFAAGGPVTWIIGAVIGGVGLIGLAVLYFKYKKLIDGIFLQISKFWSEYIQKKQDQRQKDGQDEWNKAADQTNGQIDQNPDTGKIPHPVPPTSENAKAPKKK